MASDVVVVCSEQESVGTVTFEAMASSRAIVGTNTGGTAEILEDERGWTFPVSSPSTLASHLMELRNNPDLIAERVANGRSYIANHRREAVVQRWETLLRGQNEGEG
jgi:glycosyltransferase involved in cell wall biosynthesis